jgi:ABC-type transport system substrate-binding protein
VSRAALAAFLAFTWLGSSQPAAASAPPRPIRTAIYTPASLDPARARTPFENALVVQLFSRLVETDASLSVRPSLARQWTISPDGRTYTFELAPARFHNGREVEAEDVAGTLRRLLAQGRLGQQSELATLIEGATEFAAGRAGALPGVRVLAVKQLELQLVTPYAPLLSMLSSTVLSVVPAREAEAAGDAFGRQPIGSGPFRLERWDAEEIRLAAHEGAPEGAPLSPGVSFALLPSNGGGDRVLNLMRRRELDYVFVPPGLDAVETLPGYRREQHPELAVFYIGFNTRDGSGADPRLRRGFRAGLDRAGLAREMMTDKALVTDSIIPRALPGARRESPDADAGAARGLFRELAAGGSRPRLRLHYAEGSRIELGFEWLAGRMHELGLDLVLSPSRSLRELQVLQEQGRVEAWFGGVQAEHPDAEALLRGLFRSRAGGRNLFGYASDEVDRLLDEARGVSDPVERARLYARIDEAVARDVPLVPLWGRSWPYFVGEHVEGLELPYLPLQIRLARVSLER